MNCEEFSSMIDERLEGALLEEEQAFLEHAQECEACRAQLKLAREVAELTQEFQEEAPDFIAPAMKKRFLGKEKAKSRAIASLASAAAVLLICCTVLIQSRGGDVAMPQSAPDMAKQEDGFAGTGMAQGKMVSLIPPSRRRARVSAKNLRLRDMGQVLSLSPQQAEQLYGLLSEEQRQALEPDGEGSFLPLLGQEGGAAALVGGDGGTNCGRRIRLLISAGYEIGRHQIKRLPARQPFCALLLRRFFVSCQTSPESSRSAARLGSAMRAFSTSETAQTIPDFVTAPIKSTNRKNSR